MRYPFSSWPAKGPAMSVSLAGAVLAGGLVWHARSEPRPPSGRLAPVGSSPLVHSFDGRRFVLDAEPFAGGILEVAERSGWMRLDHLREHDGALRLRVTNELGEIDFFDEVKLLVVDHAAGAEVVPDRCGNLHVLTAAVEPSVVTDVRGGPVAGPKEPCGSLGWVSSPLGRDPDDPADLRDGLVLEFPRPAGAGRAVLAVAARSTPFHAAVVRELFGLKGRELERWLRHVPADPATREALARLTLETVPTVGVETAEGWRPVEALTSLPTAVVGVQAVPLDLEGVAGDVVRVRIDGLPGSWAIGTARLDFSPAAPAHLEVLSPRVARSGEGRDARALLRAADARRHEMPYGGVVELSFAAVPARAGLERSFVLEISGHYRVLAAAQGNPQEARFEHLMNVPGALARHALVLARDSGPLPSVLAE